MRKILLQHFKLYLHKIHLLEFPIRVERKNFVSLTFHISPREHAQT